MKYALLLAALIATTSSFAQSDSISEAVPFSTNSTHLTAWNGSEYVPIFIKGVNLGVSVPGTFPGELAATSRDYKNWFEQIHEAGFNCIRLYTLHYPRFYDELKSYNEAHPQTPLYFFQGVWLEEEVPNYNHDLFFLTNYFHREMEENVGAVHGDIQIGQRFGKAYGSYTSDVSDWCVGYLMGREIYPEEVWNANASHPTFTQYNGAYLSIAGADPAEAWLVAQMDSLIQHEWNEYETMRPVSMSSWPTLDPLPHPVETHREEDSAQVDLSKVDISKAPAGLFVSYHAYPYYPDFISATPQYRSFSDQYGMNSYLGYLTDLKNHYPNLPLIIAEFGVPSSWGVAHYSASGMNHGGHTEEEQGVLGARMLHNIETAQCGGGIYFAWIDEWFKSTWITDPIEVNSSTRVLWPNFAAAEQNFGLMGYEDTVATWTSWMTPCVGCNIEEVYTKPTVGLFELYLETGKPFGPDDTLLIAFDTYGDTEGEILQPNGDSLDIRAEFLLEITSGTAHLQVMRAYDLFGIWHGIREPDQLYHSVPSATGDWRMVRWKNNSSVQDVQYIGNLNVAKGFSKVTSTDAVIIDTNSIHIRLPWILLQFSDPSHRVVFSDDVNTAVREYDTTAGVRLQFIWGNQSETEANRVGWTNWNVVNQVTQSEKTSYAIMRSELPDLPDFTLARKDAYTGITGSSYYDDVEGVLANDEQWSHGEMQAVLVDAPTKGFLQLNSDGSFSYLPSDVWDGTDEFSYKVISLGDESAVAHVTLSGDSDLETVLLTVSPNPVSDVLSIQSSLDITSVELFSVGGNSVLNNSVNASNYSIDVKGLAAGTYVLRIAMGEDYLYRKITVL
ncbi:T9SS type A sorting domain-containing protein [Phaeocystidibacter marisrubri]|uniref:T9SS type A sorting domain-containing protein n=1 Tax=Phaeocystidibacter marisrubri TaxID=1577780 RepID=A0A6L3ZHQ4_9FLAO|nr:T9SS type A sorting domain-containing protein [Phaeocystidibacter marisrubri]KAB2817546.1 T9SS type A sorting domain-containing protein [Phaeocystidibacter marisrubri]GGH74802.1 hypothetical protein GCM10011318_21170 [Phaeocystidibacter marisrubri]